MVSVFFSGQYDHLLDSHPSSSASGISHQDASVDHSSAPPTRRPRTSVQGHYPRPENILRSSLNAINLSEKWLRWFDEGRFVLREWGGQVCIQIRIIMRHFIIIEFCSRHRTVLREMSRSVPLPRPSIQQTGRESKRAMGARTRITIGRWGNAHWGDNRSATRWWWQHRTTTTPGRFSSTTDPLSSTTPHPGADADLSSTSQPVLRTPEVRVRIQPDIDTLLCHGDTLPPRRANRHARQALPSRQ
jgi:hypothetical protein